MAMEVVKRLTMPELDCLLLFPNWAKPNFFNPMRYPHANSVIQSHFSRIVPLRYPPSGPNPGAPHAGNVVQAHFSRVQPLR